MAEVWQSRKRIYCGKGHITHSISTVLKRQLLHELWIGCRLVKPPRPLWLKNFAVQFLIPVRNIGTLETGYLKKITASYFYLGLQRENSNFFQLNLFLVLHNNSNLCKHILLRCLITGSVKHCIQ
jgi:hypothetical protein